MDELTDLEDAEFFFKEGNNILMLEGKWDRAMPYFTKAIELKRNYSEAYIERGWCNLVAQNYEPALEDFSKAIELNNANGYYHRGRLHYSQGNFSLAIKDFNKVIEQDLEISKTYIYEHIGRAKVKLGDFRDAIDDFTKAIDFTTTKYVSPDLYCRRAKAKRKINDLVGAISDYSFGIDLYEKSIERSLLDTEGGYEHILSMDSESRLLKKAYGNRCYLYSIMKDFSRAEHDFMKIIELSGGGTEYKFKTIQLANDDIILKSKPDSKQESLNELEKRGIKYSQVEFIEEAINTGDENLTKLFISAGINVNHSGAFGNTPLHWAAIKGQSSLIEILLKAGANIEAKCTNYSFTPLIVAIQNNQISTFEKLIEKGSNIFAKDKDGNTPLHFAAIVGNENIVRKLILQGSNVNATDNQRVTPLYLAKYFKHLNVINLLKQAGAK